MEIKTVAPINLLYKSIKTTLVKMQQEMRPIVDELMSLYEQKKISAIGPMQFNYYGMYSNDPNTEFVLEIGIPVDEGQTEVEGFKVKVLEEFKCACENHFGDWAKLAETYAKLIQEIDSQGIKRSGLAREVYVKTVFENPINNLTQVQLGIE